MIDTAKIISGLLQAGITINEIAFKCVVSTRTVERWQEGKFKPTRVNKKYLDQWHKKKMEV